MVELQRISLSCVARHASIDLGRGPFFCTASEREEILNAFRIGFLGQRMSTIYIRIGGRALDSAAGWRQPLNDYLNRMPSRVDEY